MKKTFTITHELIVLLTAFFLYSCEIEDEDTSKNYNLIDLKGTWTAVSIAKVPSEISEDVLANLSFKFDFDGICDIWSNELGYQNQVSLVGSTVINLSDETILEIKKHSANEMSVAIPKYSNALITVKRLGSLSNNDYKFKLCHGLWFHSLDNSESYLMEYRPLANNETVQQVAKLHGDRFQFIRFATNGTGECCQGRSAYSFTWSLSDKQLSIKTQNGVDKKTKLAIVGIEGVVYFEYNYSFNWNYQE